MDVAALSMDMAGAETMQKIGLAMMNKALDTTKTMAAGELAMMDKLPQSAGHGDRLNVTA
jgi:hypothetical protein